MQNLSTVILVGGNLDDEIITSITNACNKQNLHLKKLKSFSEVLADIYLNNGECALLIISDIIDKQSVYIHQIKDNMQTRQIPTACILHHNSVVQGNKAIEAGCDFLIKNPHDAQGLALTISTAVEDYIRNKHLKTILKNPVCGEQTLEFRTLADAELLVQIVTTLYPEHSQVLIGLHELLVNAIEHGNIAITYDEKTQMQMDNTWHNAIRERLQSKKYMHKKAYLKIYYDDTHICFQIEDMGNGFDWEKFTQNKPDSKNDTYHGRGILIAKSISFDRIDYEGKGNIVTAKIRKVAQSH